MVTIITIIVSANVMMEVIVTTRLLILLSSVVKLYHMKWNDLGRGHHHYHYHNHMKRIDLDPGQGSGEECTIRTNSPKFGADATDTCGQCVSRW